MGTRAQTWPPRGALRGRLRLAAPALVLALAACGGGDGGGGGGDGDGDGPGRPDADTGGLTRPALLVRGAPFPAMVIEVDSVPGMEPFQQNPARLVAAVDAVVDKPDGVTVEPDGALDSRGADHAWTFEELQELAASSRDRELPEGAIGVHVMFLDGHSAEDTDQGVILGLAWGHTHIAMFKRTIERTCAAATIPPLLRDQLCRDAELAIWTHEMGHVIGLVDNGVPMVQDHRDQDHGRHDSSDECIMYWAYQGAALFDVLAERLIGGETAPLGFDQACLDDLAAERAR